MEYFSESWGEYPKTTLRMFVPDRLVLTQHDGERLPQVKMAYGVPDSLMKVNTFLKVKTISTPHSDHSCDQSCCTGVRTHFWSMRG